MKPFKPWRSFEAQLQQLQGRGLQVDQPAAALDYLERLGYYRLSGYWYPLRVIGPAASLAQGRAALKVKDQTVKMRTDAYTARRGVGHIAGTRSAADCSGQVGHVACGGVVQGRHDVE